MPLKWLKPKDFGDGKLKCRRTLANKGRRVEPEKILEWIENKHWKYSWTPACMQLQ